MAKQRDSFIESIFPNIGTDYTIISPITPNYNCIAFAADDYSKYWWPQRFYWPDGIPANEDLESFIECYKLLGYKECFMDSNFEEGYEKVAIYCTPSGRPTHAAKQITNEIWKSKLGPYYDIEHKLEGLNGWINDQSYGYVACILKRKQ